jgi:hypothetical protein
MTLLLTWVAGHRIHNLSAVFAQSQGMAYEPEDRLSISSLTIRASGRKSSRNKTSPHKTAASCGNATMRPAGSER